jgi:sodium-coupled monocarboxylate transporter 8/12
MNEYLIANKSMSALPIALSLLASFFSATSILGFPAEVYQYGIQYWIIVIGLSVPPIFGAFFAGPMFARLKVMSVFEYFKLRYDSTTVRLIAVACYFVRCLVGGSIYIYGPSTTLTALTSLSNEVAVVIIGLVATFYTCIGGIKAVIWTDVFQCVIMFAGVITIISKGVYDVGGFGELWKINYQNGRINFFDFDPNPFIRQSFWSLVLGNLIHSLMSYCMEQQMVQRFASAKSIRTAQYALLLNIPGQILLVSVCCFVGLVIFSAYSNCDPLSFPDKTGIKSSNQLVAYFVTDKLKIINGATGLFLAAIISGSLSSVSSTLNSVAAILWEDFLKRFSYFRNFNDQKCTFTIKILVILMGIVCTTFAILLSKIGGNLVQISVSLNGSFNGPLIGLFLLGSLVPFSNTYGATIGAIFGFGMGLWLSIGSFIMQPNYPKLGVNTNCTDFNFTSTNTTQYSFRGQEATNLNGLNKFYSISYSWFNPISVLTTLIIGIFFSLITCGNKRKLEENLILFKFLSKCDNYKENGRDKDLLELSVKKNEFEEKTIM